MSGAIFVVIGPIVRLKAQSIVRSIDRPIGGSIDGPHLGSSD